MTSFSVIDDMILVKRACEAAENELTAAWSEIGGVTDCQEDAYELGSEALKAIRSLREMAEARQVRARKELLSAAGAVS